MAVRPRDLADALVARRREAGAAHQRRAGVLRKTLEAMIGEALADRTITRAWLIGSLAHGRFGEASDVDVVVEGLAPERFAELWMGITDRLGTRVDLLRLEELSETFRRRVVEEGTRLAG